ncbi:uncharacterized protein [Diabrotica undecimpunctata]|uniref:uncharacterized protein n=1 Tax=Diabrotica undecimpunctata TaxID=50387 RepID=UPI003B636C62
MNKCTFCKCFLETPVNTVSQKTPKQEDNKGSILSNQNYNKSSQNWKKWVKFQMESNKTFRKGDIINLESGELIMNTAQEYRTTSNIYFTEAIINTASQKPFGEEDNKLDDSNQSYNKSSQNWKKWGKFQKENNKTFRKDDRPNPESGELLVNIAEEYRTETQINFTETPASQNILEQEDNKRNTLTDQEFKDLPQDEEKWEKIRVETTKMLAERLNREPGDLLMNVAEEYRQVRQEQILFENMQINVDFDKYRGNPAFFNLPPSFKEHCKLQCQKKCLCQNPIYFSVPTNAQKNEIPKMKFARTSERASDEKNILPKTRNIFTLWKRNSYRKMVLENISIKLKNLRPHRSDIRIFIEEDNQAKQESTDELKSGEKHGERHLEDSFEASTLEKLTDFKVKKLEETFYDPNNEKVNFLINGNRITEHVIKQGTMKIRVICDSGEIPKLPIINYLKFENKGNFTLRIYFSIYEKYRTFRDITPVVPKASSPFYFDRRELLLLPGESLDFPIWFKPIQTGNFNETWQITTSPQFFDESFLLLIILQGNVYQENFYEKVNEIENTLTTRVRSTLIGDILRDILNSTKYKKSQIQKYTYSEKHYFEATNQETWGFIKRPKYVYNKELVTELKNFYKKVKTPEDYADWNYSIEILLELAKKRDLLNYIDDIYMTCKEGRERAYILRELYAIPNIHIAEAQKVHDAIREPDASPRETYAKSKTNHEQLHEILQKLDRSVMINNTEREKYATVYYIVRYYLHRAYKQLNGRDVSTPIPVLGNTKIPDRCEDIPERLLFEKFDNIWIQRNRRVPPVVTEFIPKPKPKHLENIPLDQPHELYNAYFKKQKNDKKKNNAKTKKILPVTTNKNNKQKGKRSDRHTDTKVIENFDPFGNLEVDIQQNISSGQYKQKTSFSVKSPSIRSFEEKETKSYHEKYLIVYSNLCAGIDAMVAALETINERRIPAEILSELTECNIIESKRKFTNLSISIGTASTGATSEKFRLSDEIRPEVDDDWNYLANTYFYQNEKTQKYFIKGETLFEEVTETAPLPLTKPRDSFHLFTPPEEESVVSADFKSEAMQTSDISSDQYEAFSDHLLKTDLSHDLSQADYSEDNNTKREKSLDLFYYVDYL